MRILLLLPFFVLTAWADDESLMTIHRIETETADRIQAKVLDPILGAGRSAAFVRLSLETKRDFEISDRSGEGRMTKTQSKAENGDQQVQESRQTKGTKEERIASSIRYSAFHLTVLHDAKAPAAKLAAARSALLAVYESEKPEIKFHPVEFNAHDYP
ncbi:MAG: hypothetical protein HYV14_14945 [Elusimicrobia bacterium]|nr:hypothetical protein [Elusimicrobiota bacterium]